MSVEDLPRAELVRRVLQTIKELRVQKYLNACKLIDSASPLKLNGISLLELVQYKPFLFKALELIDDLSK